MQSKNYMPIREFSRLTGIRRENLRFYDQVGLISPEVRGENGYRYYSRHQLNSAYLVTGLRELGVGIEEIRQYSTSRTPEKMLALFEKQEDLLLAEIERLRDIQEIMHLHSHMARQALVHGESDFFLQERPREPIFLCPPLPDKMNLDDGGILAYSQAGDQGLNLGYPFGAVIALENFIRGEADPVKQYFFKIRRGKNSWKPAGLYAVGYGHCGVEESPTLHRKLLEFIEAQGYRPRGDAYEECPLDELSVIDPSRYVICVEILVERV